MNKDKLIKDEWIIRTAVELDENYPRWVKLNQYEVLTVSSEATNFPELKLEMGDLVYCIPDTKGYLLKLTEDIKELKCFLRLFKKEVYEEKDAFTLIVSKTIDQPDYDIEEENRQIEEYLKGNYMNLYQK